MPEDSDKSSARFAIILTIAVILVAIIGLQYGLQILLAIESRSWASENPWLNDVPKPLPPPSAPPAAARSAKTLPNKNQIQLYQYEFTVPWASLSKQEPTPMGTEVRFDSGQVVIFYDPETQVDALSALKKAEPTKYLEFQRTFASQPIESNYELYRAIYGVSPAQVSAFMPADNARRTNALLLWKLSFGFDARSGIFSFAFGPNRGFQFGDPANGRPITVRVFDEKDSQLRLIFLVAQGSSATITQDDVDSVIQSLREIPPSEL